MCAVCATRAAAVHAGQVSAGLRLPAPRQDIPCPHLHWRPDHLLHHHVVHQEHLRHFHHIPAHGNIHTRSPLAW